MKEVVQILERCDVGTCVSRLFKVKAEDGHIYRIKGLGTGWSRRDLCMGCWPPAWPLRSVFLGRMGRESGTQNLTTSQMPDDKLCFP